MKVSEAIYCMKAGSERHSEVCEECPLYGQTWCDHCQNDAIDVAIQSLEMHIPKKPIYSDFDDNGNDEIIPYKAECPVCGCEFEFGTWNDEENHHCRCGQKINWEGMSNE